MGGVCNYPFEGEVRSPKPVEAPAEHAGRSLVSKTENFSSQFSSAVLQRGSISCRSDVHGSFTNPADIVTPPLMPSAVTNISCINLNVDVDSTVLMHRIC